MRRSFLLLLIPIFSCSSQPGLPPSPPPSNDTLAFKAVYGKKFFEYDQIDHYFNDYHGTEHGLDSLRMGIIIENQPKSISDTSFIQKLEKIGYIKSSVDKSKFREIDQCFVEKTVSEIYAKACIPLYRDIMIFRKNHKVIGIAKICFHCDLSHIIGTDANTKNFGMEGDYERLGKILRN